MHHLRKLFTAALVSAVMLFLSAVSGYAQETVTHVVKRGETIESIADRYGTTADTIQRLNPDAAEFVYVGMELKIPAVKAEFDANTEKQHEPNMENQAANSGEVVRKADTGERGLYDGLRFVFEMGFGLPKKAEGVSQAFTLSAGVGMNYYFSKFYCGGQLGFITGHTNQDASYYAKNATLETDDWSLTLPVECGYALGSEKFAVIPAGGIEFVLPIKNSYKIHRGKEIFDKGKNSGGDLMAALRLGLRFRFWGIDLSAHYLIPINGSGAKPSPRFTFALGF